MPAVRQPPHTPQTTRRSSSQTATERPGLAASPAGDPADRTVRTGEGVIGGACCDRSSVDVDGPASASPTLQRIHAASGTGQRISFRCGAPGMAMCTLAASVRSGNPGGGVRPNSMGRRCRSATGQESSGWVAQRLDIFDNPRDVEGGQARSGKQLPLSARETAQQQDSRVSVP